MDEQALRRLLSGIRDRRVSLEEAIRSFRNLPFEDLGFAKVDHHRSLRCGFPEVIYCAGKTTAQVVEIFERRRVGGGNVLATRASAEVARAIRRKVRKACYNPIAQTVV